MRNTETGIIAIKKKLSVAYCFEANPIWLLSLDPKNTAHIYLVDMKSFSDLMNHLTSNNLDVTLYNSLVSFLGRSTFRFTAPPSGILYLISGSISFLNDKASYLRQERFIFSTDSHRQYRSLPSAFIPLHRIKHQTVGGASTYQGIWGCNGINISPHLTSLRRQIGDYIDYSIPPTKLPPQQICVRHNQLLPV